MKQSRSQADSGQQREQPRKRIKRSPSHDALPSPSPSPDPQDAETPTPRRTSNRNVPSSSSPVKRRRTSPQQTPIANGSPSRSRRAAANAQSASQTNGSQALDSDEDLSDQHDEQVLDEEQDDAPSAAADSAHAADADHRQNRSPDGFLPGAIRRIALSNFLTYDSVEFHVGPYLNLICGPNGTGKSSIACAIALGLGGAPALLGRASQLGSFVKRGETQGWIEIELQAAPGATNPVIKRTLTTASNKSDWFLNRRASTKIAVLEAVAEFNIDVANLCSFLPQDKVHEFAKMTDAKRLVETEKAVGGERLVRWHAKLNEHGKQAAEIAHKLKEKQDEKAHLEQRNQALQVDVQRFEERRQIQERIERLEVMLAMADYNRTKRNVQELQQERDARRQQLADIAQRGQPVRQKRTELEEKTTKLNLELERLESVHASDDKKRRSLTKSVEELGGEIEAKLSEVGLLNRKDEDRTRRIAELRKEVAERSASLGDEPGAQDTAEVEAAMRAVRVQQDDCATRCSDMQRQLQEVRVESQTIDRGMQSYREQLARLDDVPQQRLEKIRAADDHVYRATMWLRENQHRFRKPVHEPVLLEIALKDQRYAAAVESCIPFVVQKSFVCQTREDYDTFTRELIDSQRLRITVAEVEGITLESMRPDVPREQLAGLGFESYVIDLIDGPEDVLVHLCRQSHLHRLPITLDPNVDVERIERSGKFRRFIAGGENFTINVSRYGADVRQTVSRRIGPARSLVDAVDRDRQRTLSAKIQELSDKKKKLEAQTRTLLKGEQTLKADLACYGERVDELQRERRDKVGAQKQWQRERALIEARRRELRDKEREPSREEKRARLMKEVRHVAQRRAQKVQDLCAQTVQMSKVADRRHAALLSKWQWDACGVAIDNALRDVHEAEREAAAALEEAQAAHVRARREATELRAHVQRLIDEAGDLVAGLDPNDDELLNADRCSAELRAEQSKLELAEGVRPEVIDQFRARQREIASLSDELEVLGELATQTEARITTLRAKWEPLLRRLVGQVSRQFSRAFDSMGLAGELRIVEDVDFEKWKLEIMVKFRNAEELAPLSAQHQSGGERTLSTIMYIMSLLQLSRSPFTLVDEINQGMDPTAERVTHNHIVELTCQERASQYFLITPKLLPDLAVHTRQKVLLVNNGVYAQRKFKLAPVLEAKRRATRA
nr:structural maintenance of chromosome protein [Moesziomyces parantarcticus]